MFTDFFVIHRIRSAVLHYRIRIDILFIYLTLYIYIYIYIFSLSFSLALSFSLSLFRNITPCITINIQEAYQKGDKNELSA